MTRPNIILYHSIFQRIRRFFRINELELSKPINVSFENKIAEHGNITDKLKNDRPKYQHLSDRQYEQRSLRIISNFDKSIIGEEKQSWREYKYALIYLQMYNMVLIKNLIFTYPPNSVGREKYERLLDNCYDKMIEIASELETDGGEEKSAQQKEEKLPLKMLYHAISSIKDNLQPPIAEKTAIATKLPTIFPGQPPDISTKLNAEIITQQVQNIQSIQTNINAKDDMNEALHIQGQKAQSYQTLASPAMFQHTSIPKTSLHQTSAPSSIHHTAPQIKPQTTVQTTASLIERTMPSFSSQAKTHQIRSQAIVPPVPRFMQQMTPPVTSQTATPQISPQATVHKAMVPTLVHHTIPQIGLQIAAPKISSQATVQQIRPQPTVHQTLPQNSSKMVPQFIQQTLPSSRSQTATPQISPQATIPPTKLHYLKSGILNIHNILNSMSKIVKTFYDNPSEFNFDINTCKLEELVKQLNEQSERFDTEKNKIVIDTPEKGLLTLLGQQITNLVNGIKGINILLRLFARETSQKEKLRTRDDIKFLYTKILTENELIKQKQTNFLRQSNEQTRQRRSQSSSFILGS
uniref:Uncharacterized protein n=1 Tax=Meloidogyne incognita TaxID=6306 RepID=A0A914KGG1_MELIC